MPMACSPDVQTSGKILPAIVAVRSPETSCSCVSVPSAKNALHQLFVGFGHHLDQLFAGVRRGRRQWRRDLALRHLAAVVAANVSAFMRTRSTTPVKSRSSPIGSWIGTISRAQSRCSESSVRSRLARSRSRRFSDDDARQVQRGGFGPELLGLHFDAGDRVDDDEGAASATRRAARASVRKLANPGVSMMLILVFCHSACARLEESVCLRAISSSSKSVTVVPSSTLPMRLTAPATKSIVETSCVLPHPPCPTTATLRMLAAS